MSNVLKVGLVSVSDRASAGVYEDRGISAMKSWLESAVSSPLEFEARLIPDEQDTIEQTLLSLVDDFRCPLILTAGSTGPARRDVTVEATKAVGTKELPGFGEYMRLVSLNFTPTAILSRQTAVVCERDGYASLIINLPGQPAAVRETLEGVRDESGAIRMPGLFTSVPYCIELIGGPSIHTNDAVCPAWRPKNKTR